MQVLGNRANSFLGAEQQVVEVDGPRGLQGVLITAVGRGRQVFFVGFGHRGRLFGPNRGRLPAADEIEQVARPEQPVGHLDFSQGHAGEPLLIAPVIDGKCGRIAKLANVAAQDADAQRMECGDLGPLLAFLAQQGRGPFLHLGGRLVGKGDGQDAFGLDAVADQLGDAVGHHPRLAGSRPRQHQQGARQRVHGVVLSVVQVHAARESDSGQ